MSADDSRMVKDPICGKDVDTLRARAVGIFGGVTYYFCSQQCKGKFVDPRAGATPAPLRETGERRRAEPEAEPEAPPVKYAHSRVRRVTGDIGTPVVQIDLSPNKKPAKKAPAEVPADAASDELLVPARSGRGWAWLAIVMLIIAGGVIFFTLKHR
ncbi:MAG TPA: YHS domain-containing protein [Polyangia bacterium]|jgi:Cu+-exporting ATPase|nr:YHS domain-containing protein [Polyangia bacterium]